MDVACLRCGRSDGRTKAGGLDCLDCGESGVRLAVCIQAHSARAGLLPRLFEALRPATAMVAMAEPSEKPNPLATYLKALGFAPSWATHLLVLQDDSEVCANFIPAAAAAIAARPDGLIAFFAPQPPEMARPIAAALECGESFAVIPCRRWTPVVALCWPSALVADFLAWVELREYRHLNRSDDEAVGLFVRQRHLEVLATAPSLIEHPDTEVSLIGRRTRGGRNAARYVGSDDPLLIDWH